VSKVRSPLLNAVVINNTSRTTLSGSLTTPAAPVGRPVADDWPAGCFQ